MRRSSVSLGEEVSRASDRGCSTCKAICSAGAFGSQHPTRPARSGASALREVQLEAIGRIARAALAASERGDQGETARLAMAAGRLCQEIAGHCPPSAVEVPRR
ncbi:MAG: hypothetical protein LC790_06700 [Actinobacteria bacterium]|nr:hypothetical protein [Actinomycetota bacterium]